MSKINQEIMVYGDNAKTITAGQVFFATLDSVEGRAVATLHPTNIVSMIEEEVYGLTSPSALRIQKLIKELKSNA